MKHRFLGLVAALGLAAVPAMAQTQNPAYQTTGSPGQNPSGAIGPFTFSNNSDSVGFSDTSLTPALLVPTTSTAQATGVSTVPGNGTLITTRTTVITQCSSTTGVTLPAVNHYTAVILINRSGGSCLVWPSVGATLETAPGTVAAVNAPFTMLTNTDVTFRPTSATSWVQ